MDDQNLNYEELYDRLLERCRSLHRRNRKRIRVGLVFLGVFTVAMILIRWLTDSDKVVFMVIWVIGMFAISIYLIGVEYIDSSIQNTLEEVTEIEAGFSGLLPASGMVRDRIQEMIEERHQFYEDVRSRLEEALSADAGKSTAEGSTEPADEDAAPEPAAESGGEA